MKQLLTCLVYVYALVLVPNSVAAQTTWAYYLCGEINSWNLNDRSHKFGDTSNSSDNTTWTKTFTGAQLDPNKDRKAYFKIIRVTDGTQDMQLGPNNASDVELAINGGGTVLTSNNTTSFYITGVSETAKYTIKYVSSSRSGGTISVTGLAPEINTIQLKGGFDGWGGTKYHKFNSQTGVYSWTFTTTEFPSATKFKLFNTSGSAWLSYGSAITEDWSSPFNSNGNDMSYTYDNTDVYSVTIEAKKVTDGWKMRAVLTYDPHDYYWVSPQVTNGQKLPYFKMVASRNRSGAYGDGKISTKYFTFTMKDDDFRDYNGHPIDDGTIIQWYIVRDDNEVFYRPESELPVDDAPQTYDANHTGSGALDSYVNFKNYWNGYGYAGADAYKTTDATRQGSFAFRKGDHKSVTFNMNADKGHIFFNYVNTGYANPSTNSEFYLIGNFRSASETESISISDETHPLTAKYYTNGVESETYTEQCDSVVYVTTVNKPGNGWGNLYLDVNLKGNTDWKNVYRPLINLYNGLDGRALVGGLTKAGQGGNDNKGDQSLNPETTDKYTSYEFRFNATTMTYRITFHTSMYLVGPGVSSTEGEGSWDLSKVKSSEPSDPRIRLNATQEVGHYRNRVYFTEGKEFRFIQNTDEADPDYKTTWHENGNAPKFRSATTDNEYTPGNETQYKNVLTFQSNGSSSSTEPDGKSVTFDLPTGWYYINFYENKSGNPYYTIERQIDLRDFNEVYYRSAAVPAGEVRNILYRNGYNFFRVWSDHIAWAKPDDIDVFVVTAFSVDANGQATVTLTKQDGNYIPAKTGVILASAESKSSFSGGIVYKEALSGTSYNTAWMDMTPADAPATTYSGTTMLTPLYDATNLQRFINDGGTDYANYLFGFYRLNKVISNYSGANNDFGLGFWLTTGVGNTYPNSAFLRILKSDAEKMGVGTKYDMTGGQNAPVLYLMFEDASASEYTTGIRNDRVQNVSSDEWFTLEGRRVASPTGKGLYIHNGKKVVIR